MSEEREVSVKVDIDAVEAAANALGWKTGRNCNCHLYRKDQVCDLVVEKPGSSYGIGFTLNEATGATDIVYDSGVEHEMQTLIVSHYETVIANRLLHKGFKVDRKVKEGEEIKMFLRR